MSRDTYKSALYKWQWDTLDDLSKQTLTLKQAQNLSKKVCYTFELPPCTVMLGRSNLIRKSYYREHKIVLAPSWGLNVRTVLHELAHHLDFAMFGHGQHSSSFRWCYIELLDRFAGYDRNKLINSMNRQGLYVMGQRPDYVLKNGTVSRYPF